MDVGYAVRERARVRVEAVCTRALPIALTSLLLVAVMGCGSGKKPADAARNDASKPGAGSGAASATKEPKAADAATVRGSNLVRLTSKGCVQCEPQWTTIRLGQTVSWRSELKGPVTVHVARGVFERTEFVVRPGQTASSGPSRSVGSYPIWTEPAACQGFPRGPLGAGPGLTGHTARKS